MKSTKHDKWRKKNNIGSTPKLTKIQKNVPDWSIMRQYPYLESIDIDCREGDRRSPDLVVEVNHVICFPSLHLSSTLQSTLSSFCPSLSANLLIVRHDLLQPYLNLSGPPRNANSSHQSYSVSFIHPPSITLLLRCPSTGPSKPNSSTPSRSVAWPARQEKKWKASSSLDTPTEHLRIVPTIIVCVVRKYSVPWKSILRGDSSSRLGIAVESQQCTYGALRTP